MLRKHFKCPALIFEVGHFRSVLMLFIFSHPAMDWHPIEGGGGVGVGVGDSNAP